MAQKLQIVNPETGEVIDTLEQGDRVIRKKSLDAYDGIRKKRMELLEKKEQMNVRYKGYSTSNTDEMAALMDGRKISLEEMGMLKSMEPFIGRYSCAVLNKEGEPATLDDIAKQAGCSRQRAHTILKLMVKHMYLNRTQTGRYVTYFVNPLLVLRGTTINATLLKMFGKYKVQSQGGKTWEEIAAKS